MYVLGVFLVPRRYVVGALRVVGSLRGAFVSVSNFDRVQQCESVASVSAVSGCFISVNADGATCGKFF